MKTIYDTLFEAQTAAAETTRSQTALRDDPLRAVQIALDLSDLHVYRHGTPTDPPIDDPRREASEIAFLGLGGIGEVILRWADSRSEDRDRAMVERLSRLPDAVNCVLDAGRLPDGTPVYGVESAWKAACDALTAASRSLAVATDDPAECEEAARHVTQVVVASVAGAWMLGRD